MSKSQNNTPPPDGQTPGQSNATLEAPMRGSAGVLRVVLIVILLAALGAGAAFFLMRPSDSPRTGSVSEAPGAASTPEPLASGVPNTAGSTPSAMASGTPMVPSPAPSGLATAEPAKTVDLTPDASGLSKSVVVMKTSKGTVRFKLYTNDAPNSVKRFVELVQAKFYDGLKFHRIVSAFVVQVGSPASRDKDIADPEVANGGSGTKLKAEFNSRRHIRGTVALARTTDPDSADSQFYFSLGTFPHLDNKYTVIGQVIDFGEKLGEKDVLDRLRLGDAIEQLFLE